MIDRRCERLMAHSTPPPPFTSTNPAPGVEKEELVVTCQLLVGDGDDDAADLLLGPNTTTCGIASSPHVLASSEASPLAFPTSPSQQWAGSSSSSSLRVASTRLPSSFLPSKGRICWEQRLDVARFRLERLLAPGLGPIRLRLMLWASTSSSLLGQVEVPLLLPPIFGGGTDDVDGGDEAAPVLQLGVQRVTIPIFQQGASSRLAAARAPPGRRGSAVEPEAPSRKRQLPPRWRRAASEPVRGDSAAAPPAVPLSRLQLEDEELDRSEETYAPRPFVWPAQGQLVIDLSLLQQAEAEGSCERKDEEGPGAGEASPLAAAGALLAWPLDLLSREEAGFLWAQRHALLQDGRALVKLLRAVLAYGPLEAEGPGPRPAGVLEMWAAAGCRLTMLDTMKLLGRCAMRGPPTTFHH